MTPPSDFLFAHNPQINMLTGVPLLSSLTKAYRRIEDWIRSLGPQKEVRVFAREAQVRADVLLNLSGATMPPDQSASASG